MKIQNTQNIVEGQTSQVTVSPKLQFLQTYLDKIIELEEFFKKSLSESELLENKTLQEKLEEGGWLPFKQAYELQTIYKEEKTFFQALSFVKSIEICQSVAKNRQSANSAESLLMKLKQCSPKLNFVLIGKNSEDKLHSLIQSSCFKDHVKKIDIIDADPSGQTLDKENSQHRVCKISSHHACIVSGLKCLLTEQATDFAANVLEDYGFNLEAKPFKPKPATEVKSNPLDLSAFNSAGGASSSNKGEPADPVQQQLEKKRQISQMYQYYNYLIFEKNKESFNDINPDLRKMTYKYDQEVKNAYMTVQASPEVIKAAMGMNVGKPGAGAQKKEKSDGLDNSTEESKQI